jgi:3-hydroxyacyl-CoA dehydrogenase/enoyl-CoA hydratase/3-hydroxybutyryl-CoA epimerase
MIGAGFMGAGITEVSVKNNIDVYLKDLDQSGITNTQTAIYKGLKKKLKYKTLKPVEAEIIMSRIYGRLDYNDFQHADIVIEAVLEKMDLKKRIIEDIQTNCREDVIIATNTSALSVTEMAEHAKRPEQVIGMHYFSPVPKMPLLEIVKTKYTSSEVIKACYDFGVRQGKTVIVVNDCPGFYVNRILSPYLNECLLMVDEGISIESINRAMENLGFPVGPFKLLDEVGLDVAAHVAETAKAASSSRVDFPISDAIGAMHSKGLLGKKGQKGFFLYNEKGKRTGVNKDAYSFFKGSGSASLAEKEIQDRGLFMMLNEALMCLDEGIIDSEIAGDTGAVFGIGFLPFTGGPFRYMNNYGAEALQSRFSELSDKYGGRFTMTSKATKAQTVNAEH